MATQVVTYFLRYLVTFTETKEPPEKFIMTEMTEIEQQIVIADGLKKEIEQIGQGELLQCLRDVQSLCKADLVELGKVANPSPKVRLVGKAVAILLGIKPVKVTDPKEPVLRINDYWKPFHKLLSTNNAAVIVALVNFPKDNIDPKKVTKVEKECLSDPNFKAEIIAKASAATAGLAKWVIGIISYYHQLQALQEKQQALKEAENQLEELQGGPSTSEETTTVDSSEQENTTIIPQESVFTFVPPAAAAESVKA